MRYSKWEVSTEEICREDHDSSPPLERGLRSDDSNAYQILFFLAGGSGSSFRFRRSLNPTPIFCCVLSTLRYVLRTTQGAEKK